jgi:hypothetical protein
VGDPDDLVAGLGLDPDLAERLRLLGYFRVHHLCWITGTEVSRLGLALGVPADEVEQWVRYAESA